MVLEHLIMVQMMRQTFGLREAQYDHGSKGTRTLAVRPLEVDAAGDQEPGKPHSTDGTGKGVSPDDADEDAYRRRSYHDTGSGKLRPSADVQRSGKNHSADVTGKGDFPDDDAADEYRGGTYRNKGDGKLRESVDTDHWHYGQKYDHRYNPYERNNIYVSGGGSSSTWTPPTPSATPSHS